tara:strand:+ start:22825 stop:23895 length:1071 start_codon:yes stop_codon:yes gene_type:complete
MSLFAACGGGSSSSDDDAAVEQNFDAASVPDASVPDAFVADAMPAPAVAAIVPDNGLAEGGETISIQGTDLSYATAVTVGGVEATDLTVVSNDEITVVTPAGAFGAQVVEVTTAFGAPTTSFVYHGLIIADGAGATSGDLYHINPTTGVSTLIGPVGVALTGLAATATGEVFGVTASNFGASDLVSIDMLTGAATVIGPLEDALAVSHGAVPDISFVGDTLFGWTELNDDVVSIDTLTGIITVIESPQDSFGTGFAADSAGTLFLAPTGSNGTLFTVDAATGAVTAGPTMTGTRGSMKGMTFYNDLLYGTDSEGNEVGVENTLTSIDTGLGTLTDIGILPTGAIDALGGFSAPIAK